ncbi:hypothetical protein [Embleya sp. NPDC005971]|uniref:hypothetical protein n=1 Tax=Embleya sp. NPDC005971 TaxID=3156724 RepID=UPI0033F54158
MHHTSPTGIRGHVIAELTDPNGLIIARFEGHNLVTQVGDQYYGDRASGIASPTAQVTGMKLGTGSTAPSKTGAGAALVTYLTDSQQALAATYPQSSLNGSSRRITWRAVWAAGKATTASPITECVIVNDTLTDATSLAAATISRVLLTGIGSKGSGDTLTVTWSHDLLGA